MYLSNLKLWNFRKFGSGGTDLDLSKPDLVIPLTKGLNVLIGENDSGKTAIIDAIKIVLKTHSAEWIRVDHDDFYENSERFRVELRFDNLSDNEAKNFTEWLGVDGEGENAKPYLRVIMDVNRTNDRILPFDVKAGIDNEGYPLTAEAKEYLKTTYLKPLRDSKSELIPRKNSRLSQILIGHEAFRGKDEDHYLVKDVFLKFNAAIEKYFKEKCGGDGMGKDLKDKLETHLKKFFGVDEISSNFSVTRKKLKDILEILKLSLADEKMGLGSHNLLFIATEFLNLERIGWDGIRLGLIEEIEAHLFPQAQLRLIEYLQSEGTSKGIQLIMTTHSPNLGSKVKLENLIICHGGQVFPMGSGCTKLEPTDYSFLERFLDTTKANLFFAKGVILVEGIAEELLLPVLARKVDIDLTEKGISIVNVGSTAFLRYARIFQRIDDREMNIPVAVITDLDKKPDEYKVVDNDAKTESDFDLKNEISQKERKYDGQVVSTSVSPYWTFEYCIALSEKLREFLFRAIKSAGAEMTEDGYSGRKINEDWGNVADGKDSKKIAFHLYHNLILKKRISKAIIAQHLAEIIEKEDIKKLENEQSISYLIEAIQHVTG
jgi:putative ATP-dependent endonuclease of OLD family